MHGGAHCEIQDTSFDIHQALGDVFDYKTLGRVLIAVALFTVLLTWTWSLVRFSVIGVSNVRGMLGGMR